MEQYLAVLKKYAVFSGRARRKEFWYFVLFNFLISLGLGIVDGIINSITGASIGVLGLLYSLAVLVPSLAVGARRLQDTGRSGLWLLLGLIPIVGPIILIVFWIGDSEPGTNQYG